MKFSKTFRALPPPARSLGLKVDASRADRPQRGAGGHLRRARADPSPPRADRAPRGDNVLRRASTLVLAWERRTWDDVALVAAALGLPIDLIAARYKAAFDFGNFVGKPETGTPAHV